MRIVHLSTTDNRGGAARSASRLHQGLRDAGVESSMLVKHKFSNDDHVTEVSAEKCGSKGEAGHRWESIEKLFIQDHRTGLSNTHFSLPAQGYDLSRHPLVKRADIIHLHWVSGLLCPPSVAALQHLGKPLVWTLHDQRPFTGGCHFSAGCRQFEIDCTKCPQLSRDRFGLTSAALADSIDLIDARAVTVVSPSRWLADCARRSTLFRNSRTEVIPGGVDTNVFRPIDRGAACAAWKLDPCVTYLLFGAFDWTEKRKGFAVLTLALEECMRDGAFSQRVKDRQVAFLCFGQTSPEIEALGLPVKFLGRISSDEQLAAVYSAAAAVLLPSLEDNLPNVLIEAMCCGTTVVAHRIGGVPDVVEHDVTGLLVPAGDARQFAEAIRILANDPRQREILRANCRRIIAPLYSLPVQARRHLDLYGELMNGQNPSTLPQVDSGVAPSPLLAGGPRFLKILPKLGKEVRRHDRRQFFRRWRKKLLWKSSSEG